MKEKLDRKAQKELLVKSAARLYSLGIDLEAAREKVRKLVEAGVGYDSPELLQAVNDFNELKMLWDGLEQDYLELRNDIQKGDSHD